jgi:2-oxoglutarate ferredoxin oxidoreductase subunit delta
MTKQGKIIVNQELCKGCYLCVRSCPRSVLAVDSMQNSSGSYPVTASHNEKCIACGNCFTVCPDICLRVYEETATKARDEHLKAGAA